MGRSAVTLRDTDKVRNIILDAGGRIVGRTKLQKVCFFLEAAALGEGFRFKYKHYGPFSEDLAAAAQDAVALGGIVEKVFAASWGGFYSDFSVPLLHTSTANQARLNLATEAAEADSIELELAATALFLSGEGFADPWYETARRKPEKADDGRLAKAQTLYRKLQKIVPDKLPNIA